MLEIGGLIVVSSRKIVHAVVCASLDECAPHSDASHGKQVQNGETHDVDSVGLYEECVWSP